MIRYTNVWFLLFLSFSTFAEDICISDSNIDWRLNADGKIFEYALKLTKCKPSEMLHIGDSYDKDIIGAKSVNMNYIWLRHDSKIEKDIKTENIVDNFSQIPESIKKLG